MFKKIILAVIIALAIFSIIAALQPNEFHVERTAIIDAPVNVVFDQVNDYHNWDAWSPWAKIDPKAKQVIEGKAAGVGSTMSWSGNMEVGEGSMTIVESKKNELIRHRLDFIKPMKSTNTVDFTFKSEGKNKTTVSWSMYGPNNFIGKAMGLIFNCEKMVGEQYEKGLENLKAVTEKK